jgi:hypothetical protein
MFNASIKMECPFGVGNGQQIAQCLMVSPKPPVMLFKDLMGCFTIGETMQTFVARLIHL